MVLGETKLSCSHLCNAKAETNQKFDRESNFEIKGKKSRQESEKIES
jgi:hypothetical protein